MQRHNENVTGANEGDPNGDAATQSADQRLTRRAVRVGASGGVIHAGARTPEELEAMFEDALMVRDSDAVAELFEEGAVLLAGDTRAARGGEEIAWLALARWHGEHSYVADPRQVIQARDIALIIAEWGINVARRSLDGTWRYGIVLKNGND